MLRTRFTKSIEHRAIAHGFSQKFQTKHIGQVICLHFSGDLLLILLDGVLAIVLTALSQLIVA
jgi:hypothetical protein